MEFEFTTISFILFIITVLFFIITLKSLNSIDANKKLPPQPWKLPFLGHLHHLSGSQPQQALANLAKKLGPVVHLQLGEVSTILISSPPVAKQIMKTHDLCFASRPKLLTAEILGYNYSDIVFCPYGDYWRQMRKICVMELLSPKKVQSCQSLREEESWNLIEFIMTTVHTQNKINLSVKILTMMNTIICRLAVGSKCNDQALLIELINEVFLISSGFDIADLFPSIKVLHLFSSLRNKLMKYRTIYDNIIENVISDHQKRHADKHCNHEKEDLLDVLLRMKDEGGLPFPLSYDNIKAVILVRYVWSGTETSSTTIEWAMSELINNPRVMKRAQAELREALKGKKRIHESDIKDLDYLKLVIKETLRLHPPLPLLLPRESSDKCEIGGYNIPANTKVLVNVWKIGRDPEYWTDPNTFIPERFDNDMETDFEYLPFGAGRRMCPGMSMGLANTELPLAMLLYHFDWDLPDGAAFGNLDMSESFGLTLKRKNHLILSAQPHEIN